MTIGELVEELRRYDPARRVVTLRYNGGNDVYAELDVAGEETLSEGDAREACGTGLVAGAVVVVLT